MLTFPFASLFTLSIDATELLKMAENHDSGYAVALKKSKKAELEWWKSISYLTPKLSGQASAIRNNQEISFSPADAIGVDGDNPFFSSDDTSPVTLQPLYDWNAALNISVPLFQANTFPGLERAKLMHGISLDDAERQKIGLHHTILTLYIQGLMLQDQNTLSALQIEIATQNHKETTASFKIGKATEIEKIQAEFELMQATNRLRDGKMQLDRIIRLLEKRTGHSFKNPLKPLSFKKSDHNLNESIQSGLSNNLAIQQSKSNIKLKDVALRVEKLSPLPSINGQFRQAWMKNIAFSDQQSNWSASLQLQWNIWDGGLNHQNKKGAQLDLAIANLEADTLKNDVIEAIKQAHEDIIQAQLSKKSADLAVALTSSRLKSTKSGLASGAATELELNRIKLLHNEALLLQSNATYTHQLKRLDLLMATGQTPLNLLTSAE